MSVLLLDDDDDLREALHGMIEFLGHQCLSAGSLAELRAHADSALACSVAIVDVNLGSGVPSGIDAYAWLKQQHFPGSVVFLTGHARNHPLVKEAIRHGDAELLEKPIDAQELKRILLPNSSSTWK
jgi:DNA-binding NtrC family response regulator